MSNTIILVKPEEFGIEQKKATELSKDLVRIINERDVLTEQYDQVVKEDIESPQTAKKASEIRKAIKNNRTKGIEVWHKTEKEIYLRAGQFIDAVSRKHIEISKRMEDNLEQIEKYAEIQEQKRIALLTESRAGMLDDLVEDASIYPLGQMTEQAFTDLLNGLKMAKKARLEAEKKAIIEQEELNRKNIIQKERKFLVAQYKPYFDYFQTEIVEIGLDVTEEEFSELVKVCNKHKEDFEKEQAELKNRAIEAEQEAKLRQAEIDKANKARIDSEKKLEEEREERRKQDQLRLDEESRLAEEEKKRSLAPDKDKINLWVDSVGFGFNIDVSNPEAMNVAKSIQEKLNAFKTWAKGEAAKL